MDGLANWREILVERMEEPSWAVAEIWMGPLESVTIKRQKDKHKTVGDA